MPRRFPPDIDTLGPIPRDDDGPVFRAPWEAQAFGLTLALHQRGHFTWREWVDKLTAEIAAARGRGEPDDGTRYYEFWLTALEKLAAEKGFTTVTEMGERKDEWDRAARNTPHGKPIELQRGRQAP
jgi:nitrile hydratase accessory protein